MTLDRLLKSLRPALFDWTVHVDQVWGTSDADVPELHGGVRARLDEHLEELVARQTGASPLGLVIRGQAGSGKTHLLGHLRAAAHRQHAFFVLVDMTDVRDFWETVLLGYLRSLQQPFPDGRRQIDVWLGSLVTQYAGGIDKAHDIPSQRPPGLILRCGDIVAAVKKRAGADARDHADVLRALLLFACSDDDVNDMGYKWLQGIGVDVAEQQYYEFQEAKRSPSRIVQGLSWLMSLAGPTVLALDQLDAIVSEHNSARLLDTESLSPRLAASLSIVRGIAGGLMALRDRTRRTLTVVSALEATWSTLVESDLGSMPDRFEEPISLAAADQADALRHMVEARLAPSYARHEVRPPYPSYPFDETFFAYRRASTPRELLRACKAHAYRCRDAGEVLEPGADGDTPPTGASAVPAPDLGRFDDELASLRASAPLDELAADSTEAALDRLVEAACRAVVLENPTPAGVEAVVDTDFASTASYDPLHARLRLVYTGDGDRERHLSFRFLEKTHAIAFQARLKAAITASGVDRELPFRRLVVLRRGRPPTGRVSTELVRELERRGGLFRAPTDDELATLWALDRLLERQDQGLEEWLVARRPASSMAFLSDDVAWLLDAPAAPPPQPTAPPDGEGTSSRGWAPSASPDPAPKSSRNPSRAPAPTPAPSLRPPHGALLLGHVSSASGRAEPLEVPLPLLRNHVCALAGSGSGKTVFLRRIVEHAALLGVPAIVLDGANDLVRLGTPWPTPPEAWGDGDAALAARYFAQAEVVVWTPGRLTGNPLFFDPLPDFATIRAGGDELSMREELDAALEMAAASLEPLVARGSSAKAQKARAMLRVALREVSHRDGVSLRTLVDHLIEPSDDVVGLYKNGETIAREAGELLAAAIQNDPLLGGDGPGLDPGQLLTASRADRVRVSVVNLAGLADGAQRQGFVHQLAMALFTWVKRHPAQGPLSGLLVLDEAKDFVPSGKSVPSKESLVRLAAQARKYGLGLLFASQAPKSIDHNVVANCATLLIGKQSSQTAIATAEEMLASKGARVSDVGRLDTGTFYAAVKDAPRPRKIRTPLCLSHHPSSAPSEEEVLRAARESRVPSPETARRRA